MTITRYQQLASRGKLNRIGYITLAKNKIFISVRFTCLNNYIYCVCFTFHTRQISKYDLMGYKVIRDSLCGLVVRVLGYRYGDPVSISGTTRKKIVGLERGPLSLVCTTEKLLGRKLAASVKKIENTAEGIRHAGHVVPSIRKKFAITSPTSGGRSVGVVR
jgi:hypothetical protein